MKTLKYSIVINKPQELVFNKIIDKSTYADWAKAWGEGMTYDGEWKTGEYIAFFDQSQGGTKVIIEDMKPFEHIKMKHIAMVNPQAVEIELSDEMMKKWIGTLEQYYFHKEDDERTRLEVIIVGDEAFEEMMNAWEKALEYIKEICEKS